MTENNDTLLLKAAKSGDIKGLCALLAAGAKVDACDRFGTTALMFAANLGYTRNCAIAARCWGKSQLAQKTLWFDGFDVGG